MPIICLPARPSVVPIRIIVTYLIANIIYIANIICYIANSRPGICDCESNTPSPPIVLNREWSEFYFLSSKLFCVH